MVGVIAGAELERVKSAASRFHAFFEELRGAFVERDDVLKQIGFGLLAKEHVLVTGPPGTAKSRLAWAVLGRIVDENSGAPSLYARQFTESTVQTDLVGPINFKTLMETGRTEHFTDEGMLGAVHGFLDEVFDGRDMLLRSTLNVLHERELKQGTKITPGLIECAVMTTNRYLSEVLEGSREALLAFVDRVAHVAFVPKGFGGANSLSRLLQAQLAGTGSLSLDAHLTIQDLDALQATVDAVPMPPELCDVLGEFVRGFESEIAAAVRADPSFVPTRYLSTRTVLRLGRALRAACVYDWACDGQQRGLRVELGDFESLRLSLLLSGPSPEHIEALLASEPDPRERRQLETLRSEREIFDRCLKKVRAMPFVVAAAVVEQPLLAASEPAALKNSSAQELLHTARKLAEVAALAGDGPAVERLAQAVAELSLRAVSAGLDAAYETKLAPQMAADHLSSWADELDALGGPRRAVGRWLRGKALEIMQQSFRLAPARSGEQLEQWLGLPWDVKQAETISHGRLRELEGALELCTRLISRGAQKPRQGGAVEPWQLALRRAEDDLVAVWDAVLRRVADQALKSASRSDLSAVLSALSEPLSAARGVAHALEQLGGDGAVLERRVFGVRLSPLVQATCERFAADDRAGLMAQVDDLLQVLARFGLERSIERAQLLGWITLALLRAEPDWAALADDYAADYEGYRALRGRHERRTLAFTLAELALRLLGKSPTPGDDLIAPARELIGALPLELRQRVVSIDVARLEAALALIEGWWRKLEQGGAEPRAALEALSTSRFLHVTRDEGMLVRFALEARLLQQLLPDADVAALEQRIAALESQTSAAVQALMKKSLDADWQATLGTR